MGDVAGPHYMAYVTDDSVAFDPVVHARMDEYIFAFRRVLDETEKPTFEIEIKNPRIGLLNPSRKQWAWFAWLNPANGHVEPLFLGRIVANPNKSFDEVITVEFTAWPTDFFKRRQVAAEALKVLPFWDEVMVAVEKSDDPDTVLQSRSALWCVDPITLAVTAEDILDDSAGNIDITDHFYDSLDMHDGDAPLTSVMVDATISWVQTARGFMDMGQQLISTYAGDGLISDWPKPLTSLGGGWTVQYANAYDYGHTNEILTGSISYSWTNPDKTHNDGDTLSISFSETAPGNGIGVDTSLPPGTSNGMVSAKLTEIIRTGLLDPSAVDGDGDPAPINKPS